jgi:hypothetical protein
MLSVVHQNIDEPIAHFARRPQRAQMVSLAPKSTAADQGTIDRSRNPDLQSRHPARERYLVERFDEEMNVVCLH